MIAFIDGIGGPEMVLVLLLILLLFGGKSLPEFARGFGKAMREFRKAASGVEQEFKRAMEEVKPELNPAPKRTGIPAKTVSNLPPPTKGAFEDDEPGYDEDWDLHDGEAPPTPSKTSSEPPAAPGPGPAAAPAKDEKPADHTEPKKE